MKVRNLLKPALIVLVCAGVLAPPFVEAAPPDAASKIKARTPRAKSVDIALDEQGVFHGDIINEQAKRVAKQKVEIRAGRRVAGRAVTDEKGQFQIRNLKTGVYQLVTNGSVNHVRVWNHRLAPPGAKKQALLLNHRVARGQDNINLTDAGTALTVGLGITTTILSALTLEKINDVEDCLEKIKASLN